jgi:hypothetical protein
MIWGLTMLIRGFGFLGGYAIWTLALKPFLRFLGAVVRPFIPTQS